MSYAPKYCGSVLPGCGLFYVDKILGLTGDPVIMSAALTHAVGPRALTAPFFGHVTR
jgi:hypothetical protein